MERGPRTIHLNLILPFGTRLEILRSEVSCCYDLSSISYVQAN